MSAEDLFRENRWTEAEKAFSAYASRHPRPLDAGAALLRIADCQTARGDRKKARAAYAEADAFHKPDLPGESSVRAILRVSALALCGDVDGARAIVERRRAGVPADSARDIVSPALTNSWNPANAIMLRRMDGRSMSNGEVIHSQSESFPLSLNVVPLTTNSLFTITLEGETDSYGEKAIDRINGYVVSETRLDIHLPKVLDPQESVVRDIDKLSTGSVTFVNLDNDDDDALFDDADGEVLRVDAATGDRTGDNELVKLRLNLSSDTPSNATVRLTVPKGAGYVAVWTNNTKTASARYTPGTDISLSDFRRDGDCLVKDLWAEGVAPHAEPRGTEFLMECTLADGCVVSSRVSLTVLGVQSVIWKGRGNSRYDTNELDGDPNWPSGLSPGSLRVFPGARAINGSVESEARDKVGVEVTLSAAPPVPVDVYLRSFDVDDPTADETDVVDGFCVDDESHAWDNRGSTPEKAGAFVGNATPSFPFKLSFAAGQRTNETEFQTTLQPGDNFRVVANADRHFLVCLENADGPAQSNPDKQRIRHEAVTGALAAREIREPDHYASNVLTVWRLFHLEIDTMASPNTASPEERNAVTGRVTKLYWTSNLTFRLNPIPTSQPTDYVGGVLSVGGVDCLVQSAYNELLTSVVLVQSEPNIRFALHDDDVDTIVLPTISTNHVLHLFESAYIVPVHDGGGNVDNDTANIPFRRNIKGSSIKSLFPPFIGSMNNRASTFWAGYCCFAFQPSANPEQIGATGPGDHPRADKDPDAEVALRGVNIGGVGSLVFLELCREKNMNAVLWANLFSHEVAHQFGVEDEYIQGTSHPTDIMGMGMSFETSYFHPKALTVLRSFEGNNVSYSSSSLFSSPENNE